MLHSIAIRNVKVHWKQSLAALLSISASFFAFVLFQGYILDVERMYWDGYVNRSMLGDMIIQNKNATTVEGQRDRWKFMLTKEDQMSIARVLDQKSEQIEVQVHFLDFQGLIATGNASKIFLGQAVDADAGAKARRQWAWSTLYGVPLHETKVANPILMSMGLAKQLGCVPDREIYSLRREGGYPAENRAFQCRRPDFQLSVTTETGTLNAMDFEAVGLIDAGYKDLDQRTLHMPLARAQRLLNTDKLTMWTVRLKEGVAPKPFIQDLNQKLQQVRPELVALDWRDHRLGHIFKQTMSLLDIFRNFVTIVVALISVLSVMNTMVKIVKERTREIGTLLSLGFQRTQVLGIFLLESMLLATLGCAVGSVLSLIATFLLNSLEIKYKAGLLSQPIYFTIQVNPWLHLIATLLLLVVTVLTSFVACRSTIQKKIVECLASV